MDATTASRHGRCTKPAAAGSALARRAALPAMLLGLATAGAQAQGSVEVFGFMDIATSYARGSLASRSSLSSGNWGTSRVGFRGTEDLGGGLKAGFWLESGIFGDTGTGPASNTNNQPGGQGTAGPMTFSRRSTLSLSGPFGELRAGRDLQPHYLNIALNDPFAHIGIGQAVVLAATVAGTNTSWVRASNALHYFTPDTLGGAFVHAAWFMGENLHDGSASARDGTGYSLRAGYDRGGVNLAAGYMRTAFASGDVSNLSLGGSFALGPLRVMGVALRDQIAGPPPDGRGWQLGVRLPLGVHDLRAQVSQYRSDAALRPGTTKVSAGYAYSLSKRTALYGILARVNNRGGAAQTLAGAVAGPDGRATGFDLGIRHIF